MDFILNVAYKSIEQVWGAWLHNWPYLGLSIIIATVLKRYVKADKVSAFLLRYRGAGVAAATAAAVGTPLCSCGTTAVVLGMMASMVPWAPIVAFMVASPLTSPEGLIYSAGLFGWPFALAFFIASIVLGLFGGWLAGVFESWGWLANQNRFAGPASRACGCSAASHSSPVPARVFSLDVPAIEPIVSASSCGCGGRVIDSRSSACGCAGAAPARQISACGCGDAGKPRDRQESTEGCGCGTDTLIPAPNPHGAVAGKLRTSLMSFLQELYGVGKHLFLMFTGFAFVGYFLNGLIPADWVGAVFGGNNIYNVPLAATLGLPLYINSEASLPLIRSLLDSGMSQGAALAFTISGSGTSIGAIGGALTIARWRVVALVVGVLWLGAILTGLAFNLALSLNLF